LDQRDQLVTDLSKLTNVSVVPQGSKFNVFIGTGQTLVIGDSAKTLQASSSLTDPSRIEVSFENNGTLVQLPESGLNGGQLGALFSFRASTLDVAQNSLGRIAIGIATSFNDQHKLGQDLNGQQGTDFFAVGSPISSASSNNTTTAAISATISDVSALTTSDYRVQFSGGNYTVTRLSDGVKQATSSLPVVIDGVTLNLTPPPSSAPANGDEFLIRPTANGASAFRVVQQDTSKIAAAASVTTTAPTTNTGSGKISSGSINSLIATGSTSVTATISAARLGNDFNATTFGGPVTLTFVTAPAPASLTGFPAGATVSATVGNVTTNYPPPATVPYTSGANINVNGINFTIKDGASPPANGDTFTLANTLPVAVNRLTYIAGTNSLTGFPATANVTVTNGTTSTTYPAGANVPFIANSTVSFQGKSFVVSGVPKNGDVFDITPNTNGTADNRNAILLSGLQSKNILINGSSTAQGAYGQLVSLVGSKAQELKATSESESKLLEQAVQSQQSNSGVNLDEEAANLLRYQQAYQAAAKLLQIAGQLFDSLLAIGR
jgi:flagellar hook-associated protein 1 FlgK